MCHTSSNSFSLAHHSFLHQIEIVGTLTLTDLTCITACPKFQYNKDGVRVRVSV